MKKILLGVAAIGTLMALNAPAQAAGGCGRGMHRVPNGDCVGNGWRGGPGPAAWVEGRYYPGHGYWSGGQWYHHRYHGHGGWRYR